MKKISPKEDVAVIKQQFWDPFAMSGWFNTVTNAQFTKEDSIHRVIQLCASNKCPPLKEGIEQSKLACWLKENYSHLSWQNK